MANKKLLMRNYIVHFAVSRRVRQRLIAGPEGVYICDECVEICAGIVEEMYHEEESVLHRR